MIVRYYKGYIGFSKLENMLKITKNGTTAYHVVCTLNELGFKACGRKLNKLTKTKIPFIANVLIDGVYKHFIVVYEVSDKYVLIADPANGIKKISFENFYNIWTGINIEMYPNKIIVNEPEKSILSIFELASINKKHLVFIGLCSLFITFLAIVSSFFFQLLIDNMNDNIIYVIVVFLVLFALKNIMDYVRGKYLINFTYNTYNYLTSRVFNKIIKLPYHYYHNHTTGEVISKINDLSNLKNISSKLIAIIFIDFPLIIFSGILLFIISKILFIVVLIILILYIFIICIYHSKINNYIEELLKNKADINSFMTESIGGFETVKGLNIENKICQLFEEKYASYTKRSINLNYLINRQQLFKNLINEIGGAFVIIVGIYLIKIGHFNLSTLITYNILITFFLEPIKNIIDLEFEFKESYYSIKRILYLVDVRENIYGKCRGDIEFKNVSFGFNFNYILKNVNLKIKEASKVLITGESGSGKSTLLKIIKGYYSDYEGQLFIGNRSFLRFSNIVYISQKEILFTGTINYNLSLKDSNDLEIIKSICHINDITAGNELNGNMFLEEDGFNISGGQKQRIVLGRALHNFDILLIDEGLSGLDVNLERKILKKLFTEYSNKTIIIVSHRLDNLDLFDQYIKLDCGNVVIDSSRPRKEK